MENLINTLQVVLEKRIDKDFDEVLTIELKEIIPNTFPLVAFKNSQLPYVVYTSMEPIETKVMDGYMDNYTNDVDIYIVSKTYEEMKTNVKLIIEKLKGMEGRNVNGIYFDEVKFNVGSNKFFDKESKTYVYTLPMLFYY